MQEIDGALGGRSVRHRQGTSLAVGSTSRTRPLRSGHKRDETRLDHGTQRRHQATGVVFAPATRTPPTTKMTRGFSFSFLAVKITSLKSRASLRRARVRHERVLRGLRHIRPVLLFPRQAPLNELLTLVTDFRSVLRKSDFARVQNGAGVQNLFLRLVVPEGSFPEKHLVHDHAATPGVYF